jgi:hypothetical protein
MGRLVGSRIIVWQMSLIIVIVINIISPLQSTSGHRPLQLLTISLDLWLLASGL